MRYRSLAIYFLLLVVLCAAVIVGARMLGREGAYLAQFYMLTPAVAALITRLFFYKPRFSDAGLRLGRLTDYIKYWLISLGIVALYFASYTLLGAIQWDLSGSTFLGRVSEQFAASGQDMASSLPPGFTPHKMLWVYFIGGLTIFNILPGLIAGFGEEFGHRGLMFPLLYQIRPWVGFVIGGLIWFIWHLPLVLVMPQAQPARPAWQNILNGIALAIGSICTFSYLAYVYIRTGSIFVASIAHITLNNASMALSYFVVVRDQVLANLGTVLVMVLVVVLLHARREFGVFPEYFRKLAPLVER
ncbi:MAG: CPBP family intramembrane glutamic endopeptidase [Chloroflexota bacterium]